MKIAVRMTSLSSEGSAPSPKEQDGLREQIRGLLQLARKSITDFTKHKATYTKAIRAADTKGLNVEKALRKLDADHKSNPGAVTDYQERRGRMEQEIDDLQEEADRIDREYKSGPLAYMYRTALDMQKDVTHIRIRLRNVPGLLSLLDNKALAAVLDLAQDAKAANNHKHR